MGTANHRVNVVRLGEPRVHSNADSLELFDIEGYQVVTKKGNFKVGDLGIYIQPDSIVPQLEQFSFLWADKVFPDGIVPEKYRRITVRRFRKEWSEGLLLPLTDFGTKLAEDLHSYRIAFAGADGLPKGKPGAYAVVGEGDDVAELLGITHYEAPEPGESTQATRLQYNWPPKSLRGWYYWFLNLIGLGSNIQGRNERGPNNQPPVYDVEALKNYKGTFEEGEQVVITEKIHGSNARYTFDGNKFFVGSRKLWKSEKSGCVWRKAVEQHPWIEKFCRANPGYTLYGEVVPTQDGFRYGCEEGQVKFFGFDVCTPEGEWLEQVGLDFTGWAPVFYMGPYNAEVVAKYVDGPSTVPGAKNIREGVVIKTVTERSVRGLGRAQLKVVSNKFLEKQ